MLSALQLGAGAHAVACAAPSSSLVVYGAALMVALSTAWALLERHERRASQRQNNELSRSVTQIIEQHYRERVQAEERHLLSHDSSVRNIFEHLERALLGKPKS